MTKAQIVQKFELYMDDMTELSTSESGELFDKIYEEVSTERPWEYLKKELSGTFPLTIPSDFLYFLTNNQYQASGEYGSRPTVRFESGNMPIVSFSDRNNYKGGVAYIEAGVLTTKTPGFTGMTATADYMSVAPTLTNNQSPWFPIHHDVIYHGMCRDAFMIMQTEKAKSYALEHEAQFQKYMGRLALWNARLIAS